MVKVKINNNKKNIERKNSKNNANNRGRGEKGKIKGLSERKIEEMVDEAVGMIEDMQNGINGNERGGGRDPIEIKASKPISQIKKGDKMKIDGKEYEVDAHYELINHGNTKEMAVEIFDSEDKECQLRYFDDQVESTIELYELEEIMYLKRPVKRIEW